MNPPHGYQWAHYFSKENCPPMNRHLDMGTWILVSPRKTPRKTLDSRTTRQFDLPLSTISRQLDAINKLDGSSSLIPAWTKSSRRSSRSTTHQSGCPILSTECQPTFPQRNLKWSLQLGELEKTKRIPRSYSALKISMFVLKCASRWTLSYNLRGSVDWD
jgi:hypothetical protein